MDEEARLKRNAYMREWSLKNSEKVSLWKRRHYKKNRERRVAYVVEWQKKNPEAVRVKWDRSRARKRGLDKHYTLAQWFKVRAASNGFCFYCHRHFDLLIPEHKTPLSRGGSNTIRNIAASCRNCNFRKRTKTASEFKQYLQLR